MKIGIDISQIVYEGTGVAKYVRELVKSLIVSDSTHEYKLFGSSLRKRDVLVAYTDELKKLNPNINVILFPFPPFILDLLWNRLHVCPIELFIGKVDVFWSSDWSQPPLHHAIGMTTIHDLVVYTYPEETAHAFSFNFSSLLIKADIVATQKRRLQRAIKECEIFLCDSIATKKDCENILNIPSNKLHVVYPGFSL